MYPVRQMYRPLRQCTWSVCLRLWKTWFQYDRRSGWKQIIQELTMYPVRPVYNCLSYRRFDGSFWDWKGRWSLQSRQTCRCAGRSGCQSFFRWRIRHEDRYTCYRQDDRRFKKTRLWKMLRCQLRCWPYHHGRRYRITAQTDWRRHFTDDHFLLTGLGQLRRILLWWSARPSFILQVSTPDAGCYHQVLLVTAERLRS